MFWFPADDKIVHFRSWRPDEQVWDQLANKKRIKMIQASLQLEPRYRVLSLEDYEAVGRNANGQNVREREALEDD